MVSIGEMLRAGREAQGRSVADVATELCITERYLVALEENNVQVLPGLFFYQSFVRQYAALLGIDARPVNDGLSRMASAAAPSDAPATLSQTFDLSELRDLSPSGSVSPSAARSRTSPLRAANPSPGVALLERIAESKHRMSIAGYPAGISTAALVGALVLGAGIFAWWNHTPQAGAATVAMNAKPVSVKVETSGANGSLQNTSIQNAALQTPEDENEVVLSLSANEETWVSISSHGKVIYSGIMQPSESRTLKGGEVATMKIGNAGGVDIQLNGKSIGKVGPRGQVRTVRFTRQDFHVIAPEDQSSQADGPHDL